MEHFIGLMSGTSLDGLDLVLAAFEDGQRPRVVDFQHIPFEQRVCDVMLQWNQAEAWSPDRFLALNQVLGRFMGEAVARFAKSHEHISIRAVGMHGITARHCPELVQTPIGYGVGTLQMGDPHMVAALSGLPVIFDFRHADMALGGQGAPLAPFLDHLMFRHSERGRILLNLGGIANLSFLQAGGQDVLAFDSGPANMVIDSLMRRHPLKPAAFDEDGHYAAAGKVIQSLLDHCLGHGYFARKPPKSTGRELFGDAFTATLLEWPDIDQYNDLITTATRLTAITVSDAIRRFAPSGSFHDLIVSGGGAHNQTLMGMLQEFCPDLEVSTSAEHGLNADAKEALLMAALAHAHCHRIPGNLPSVTGASRKVVLGACTP